METFKASLAASAITSAPKLTGLFPWFFTSFVFGNRMHDSFYTLLETVVKVLDVLTEINTWMIEINQSTSVSILYFTSVQISYL